MEEFFRFIQQSGRERSRLIQKAHSSCDSVVPPSPMGRQSDKAPTGHIISSVNRDDEAAS